MQKKQTQYKNRDKDGLNLRESLFCRLYIINRGNGRQAAEGAGYHGDCNKRACQLLSNDRVAAVIRREGARLVAKAELKAERVIEELTRIAFFDVRRLFRADNSLIPMTELDEVTASGIAGIVVRKGGLRLRFHSKIHAIDLLGQFLKLWDGRGDAGSDRLNEVMEAFRKGPVGKETIQ